MIKGDALFPAASAREFPQTHDPGQRNRHPIGTRPRSHQRRRRASHVPPSRAVPRPGGKTRPPACGSAQRPMHRGRLCVTFALPSERGVSGGWRTNLFDPHTSSLSPSSLSSSRVFAAFPGAAAWFERSGAAVLGTASASLCMVPLTNWWFVIATAAAVTEVATIRPLMSTVEDFLGWE